MTASQQSFETRFGRFNNAFTILQGWSDYLTSNLLITIAGLIAFIAEVILKDEATVSTKQTLDTFRDERRPLVYKFKDTNPNCMELRIEAIENYLGSESQFKSARKSVKAILKKFRPRYPKRAEGAPRGAGKSPSEKSFDAAVGNVKKVIKIITNLGAAYAPANPNISVANMTALETQVETLNVNIAGALENYGNAVASRKALYDGPEGMKVRIDFIKSNLSSLVGGKKNQHYIEFSQAIEGT